MRRRPDIGRRGAIVGALGASLAACVATLAVWPEALAADPPRTHEVVIQGLLNVPETVTVKRGDIVVWTNKDPFPHTVTATGAFDSGPIAAGKSWRFTARRVGTYSYVCSLHSNMKGTLRVE